MKAWRRAVLGTAAVALAGASLVGCGRSEESAVDAFSSTAQVTRGNIATVVQMAGQVVAVNERYLTLGTVAGRVVDVMVEPGQAVTEGQPLLRLDDTDLARKLREAEADIKAAEAELLAVQRQASAGEMAQAQAELQQADYELAVAQLKLRLAEDLGLKPLEQSVADAETALRLAQDQLRIQEIAAQQATIRSLEYDLAFYERTLRDSPQADPSRPEWLKRLSDTERDLGRARVQRDDALRSGHAEVANKEGELVAAQSRLARARAGDEDPTAAERLGYDKALVTQDKAAKKVSELEAGLDSAAVKAAKTAYDAAAAKVEEAKANLEAATLRAPFAGVILAVYVHPEDRVQGSDNLIYLADLTDLQVQAQTTEVDVPRLALDQVVRITFDSYPGQVFAGKVLALPARGKVQGGLAVYEVRTSLDGSGPYVRLGMMANVRVVVGEKLNALVIPAAAVQYRAQDDLFVQVRDAEGQTREENIKVGINDGILVEVLSGLSAGQTVLVPLVPPTQPVGPIWR